jgi:hypothetical protein
VSINEFDSQRKVENFGTDLRDGVSLSVLVHKVGRSVGRLRGWMNGRICKCMYEWMSELCVLMMEVCMGGWGTICTVPGHAGRTYIKCAV